MWAFVFMKTNSRFVLFTNSDKSYKIYEGNKNIATFAQDIPQTPALLSPEEVEAIRTDKYDQRA